MNHPSSVAYGWGALILAAGVAFYYARKDIDARRRSLPVDWNANDESLEDKIKRKDAELKTKAQEVGKAIQDELPNSNHKDPPTKAASPWEQGLFALPARPSQHTWPRQAWGNPWNR
ncbi:hypothetical protein H4R34_004734 [Dimargaris verticillata]|uniref:Uncharacterized protein n=1 Tax=Dimargaris verticillata TaxID=2761393 RepID=A0A9W8B3L8_9FUNG|nr:hypothetical protein H4R34_004734 [Dimargaris verticillata]